VSVTTTTLLRDSTLDSVTSPSGYLHTDPGSAQVHIVNVEDQNQTRDLLCDDVTPEPEVVVHPVEKPSLSPVSSDLLSCANETATHYLYDDIDGHYSPAGRGYPHGFHHSVSDVPQVHVSHMVSGEVLE